ncbi:MAG: TIM barrel protein [Bacteroidetes bacterium]|nr:TIM barrel protein [Bacteroidota bacterium]
MKTVNTAHQKAWGYLEQCLIDKGLEPDLMLRMVGQIDIAIPSWALGTGGTRFGRFGCGGEPRTLAEKLNDVAVLNRLTRCAGSISLHIPWDKPSHVDDIRDYAQHLGIRIGSVNSNTFQDLGEAQSYKFGSLSHVNRMVREQAVAHNMEVVEIGKALGAETLSLWLADGSSYPGQDDFMGRLDRIKNSLREIYDCLPDNWQMLIEYKPFEPHFYSMCIPDWGTAWLLARECGPRALVLVDLGHHLPNTNIAQIVATLLWKGALGGFHFNDSKYADDDLTVGCLRPYDLYLIFCELTKENTWSTQKRNWMIDASHNLKDPLEDLIQSIENIQIALAKSLCLDRKKLALAQEHNDIALCEQVLLDAYLTDMRPLVAEARLRSGGMANPLSSFRDERIREKLIGERGSQSKASGL